MGHDSGVFTTRELHAMGGDDYWIRCAVRQGSLIRHRHGWYSTPTADLAAVSAVNAGGVLACVSAFDFHQRHDTPTLWVPPNTTTHVRISRNGTVRSNGGIVCECKGYGRARPTVTAVDSVADALNAAARCVDDDYWIAMCDSVLHHQTSTIPDLQAEMGVVPQRVRDLMSRCDPRSESGIESIARVRLRAAGYRVHVQPVIGHRRQRGDLRVGRLLIECDGDEFHGDRAKRRADKRRDRRTLANGWLTIRITYEDILYDWPATLADIAAIVATGRHRIRGPMPALIV